MELRPIRTETEYDAALAEVHAIFNAKPGTPDADRREVLVLLIKAYEQKHYPMPLPDPIEAILHDMERRGMTRRDLEPIIGSRARVAEILNCKRALTMKMIRRLNAELGIPADVLIRPYPLQAAPSP